jgi:hypothetical protein
VKFVMRGLTLVYWYILYKFYLSTEFATLQFPGINQNLNCASLMTYSCWAILKDSGLVLELLLQLTFIKIIEYTFMKKMKDCLWWKTRQWPSCCSTEKLKMKKDMKQGIFLSHWVLFVWLTAPIYYLPVYETLNTKITEASKWQ